MVQPDPPNTFGNTHSDANREEMQPSDGVYAGYMSESPQGKSSQE